MVLSQKLRAIFNGTSKIIPDVYQLTIRGSNVILVGEGELTLVDADFFGSSAQIVDFIRSWGGP